MPRGIQPGHSQLLDEAVAEYERVKVISPKYPDMALEHGYTLFLKKQYLDALKMYEEAIRESVPVAEEAIQEAIHEAVP